MTVEDMTPDVREALRGLLLRMADDALIIAHRHSEWTGLGPLLEEDIAFSSIAQDKLGHSQALYQILHEHFGELPPDQTAFNRKVEDFRCCHLVELPNTGYDVALMRHFLFDASEYFRYTALVQSAFEPLAAVARKVSGEIKYHLYHARTWVIQLGSQGSAESHERMQHALNTVWPFALGMFEDVNDAALRDSGVFIGEQELYAIWHGFVADVLSQATLIIPTDTTAVVGGRTGVHSEHIDPLLKEMTEVFVIDPSAEW